MNLAPGHGLAEQRIEEAEMQIGVEPQRPGVDQALVRSGERGLDGDHGHNEDPENGRRTGFGRFEGHARELSARMPARTGASARGALPQR